MSFEYSFGWMFAGIAIIAAGFIITRFYKQIADNFLYGVGSYNKVKKVGVITIIVGMLVVFNLHVLVLELIANTFFGSLSN